jgi:hypothetical protein
MRAQLVVEPVPTRLRTFTLGAYGAEEESADSPQPSLQAQVQAKDTDMIWRCVELGSLEAGRWANARED